MSTDTNAYVAVPMDGKGIMSSSAAPVRRRHRSCWFWLLGGVLAIVLLMLGIPLWLSHHRHSHHMMMGQSHGEGLLSDEGSPDGNIQPVKDGSVTMYKGQPIVLAQEHGKTVEKHAEDSSSSSSSDSSSSSSDDSSDSSSSDSSDSSSSDSISSPRGASSDSSRSDSISSPHGALSSSSSSDSSDSSSSDSTSSSRADSSYSSSTDSSSSSSSDSTSSSSSSDEELSESGDSSHKFEDPIEELTEEEVGALERMGGN